MVMEVFLEFRVFRDFCIWSKWDGKMEEKLVVGNGICKFYFWFLYMWFMGKMDLFKNNELNVIILLNCISFIN